MADLARGFFSGDRELRVGGPFVTADGLQMHASGGVWKQYAAACAKTEVAPGPGDSLAVFLTLAAPSRDSGRWVVGVVSRDQAQEELTAEIGKWQFALKRQEADAPPAERRWAGRVLHEGRLVDFDSGSAAAGDEGGGEEVLCPVVSRGSTVRMVLDYGNAVGGEEGGLGLLWTFVEGVDEADVLVSERVPLGCLPFFALSQSSVTVDRFESGSSMVKSARKGAGRR